MQDPAIGSDEDRQRGDPTENAKGARACPDRVPAIPFPDPGNPEDRLGVHLSRCHCLHLRTKPCDFCVRLVGEATERGRRWADRIALRDPDRLEKHWPPSTVTRAVALRLVADLAELAPRAAEDLVGAIERGGWQRWVALRGKDAAGRERAPAYAARAMRIGPR